MATTTQKSARIFGQNTKRPRMIFPQESLLSYFLVSRPEVSCMGGLDLSRIGMMLPTPQGIKGDLKFFQEAWIKRC